MEKVSRQRNDKVIMSSIITESFPAACGGLAAVASCTNGGCAGGLTCTPSNYCCECPVGRSAGRCTNVCDLLAYHNGQSNVFSGRVRRGIPMHAQWILLRVVPE